MNRRVGKRALIVAMTTGVLFILLALALVPGVLAELITYDFTGKVAGSTVENPHVAYSLDTAIPDESPATILAQAAEFSQADYDGLEADDATYASQVAINAWLEVGSGSASGGGISNNSGRSSYPSLAMDASGNAYVAWGDNTSGDSEIYVKRFDGSSWVEVGSGSSSGGGISDNDGLSYYPSLALDASGNPYVAWYDHTSANLEIYIKRFDGANWVEVGTGSATGGGISDSSGASWFPSLALDAWGNPYVAWGDGDDASGNYEIYVKRFDGSSWVEVGSGSASGGGISDCGGESRWSSLALDASRNPYVAWEDYATGEIYIKRFDGSNWVEVGSGSASGGGISDNSRASRHPSLALDASGNSYVAWDDGGEIYVKRFDGANWVEVGSGSASGGGIGRGTEPSLALDGSGNPYVAWDGWGICVKRFDGANWVEVGSGSASGGGISNDGNSYSPSLALDASGNPYVAWYDISAHEIYIKRFGGKHAEHLYSFHSIGRDYRYNRS